MVLIPLIDMITVLKNSVQSSPPASGLKKRKQILSDYHHHDVSPVMMVAEEQIECTNSLLPSLIPCDTENATSMKLTYDEDTAVVSIEEFNSEVKQEYDPCHASNFLVY